MKKVDESQNVLYEGQVVIVETDQFRDWLDGLRDRKARLRIDDRLRRLADGNAGDTKSVGDGVLELLHLAGWCTYRLAKRRRQEFAGPRHRKGQSIGQGSR
jgi:putative addiction module killer protein